MVVVALVALLWLFIMLYGAKLLKKRFFATAAKGEQASNGPGAEPTTKFGRTLSPVPENRAVSRRPGRI